MDQHHTTVAQLPLLAYADNEMKFLMKKKIKIANIIFQYRPLKYRVIDNKYRPPKFWNPLLQHYCEADNRNQVIHPLLQHL